MSLELYPHQKEAIAFAKKKAYSLCVLPMGAGKTLIAINVIKDKYPAVVICPAFLRLSWKREIEKHLGVEAVVWKRGESLRADVLIVNYEILGKLPPLPEVNAVVVDEIHYIKNASAQRTKRVAQFIGEHMPDIFLGMTGTLMTKDIDDLYMPVMICSLVHNQEWASDYSNPYKFRSRYMVKKRSRFSRTGFIYEGAKKQTLPELQAVLAQFSFVRKASEVLDFLPPFEDRIVECTEPKGLSNDFNFLLNTLEKQMPQDEHFMTRKANAAKAKSLRTVEYVRTLFRLNEHPIVVFTDHIEAAMRLARELRAPYVTGLQTPEERERLVQEFQAGDHKVIVATIRSLGVGVTLHAARHVVFNDISYSSADNEQAKKRIHRIGQNRACIAHYLVAGKLDRRIHKIVKDKAARIDDLGLSL